MFIRKVFKRLSEIYARYYSRLDSILLVPLFSKSKFGSSLYYTFFDTSFRREHFAVLNGKKSFLKRDKKGISHLSNLRRSIHRLEKGLIMRPRKASFASDYIHNAVKDFIYCYNNQLDSNTVNWANAVLNNYFTVVEAKGAILKAKEDYLALLAKQEVLKQTQQKIPYTQVQLKKELVDFSQFYELCKNRRSVRWFNDIKPSEVDIQKAVEAALQAPSACNRQAFRFCFVQDESRVTEFANLPMGTAYYAENIPTMGFLIGDLSAYKDERDRHLIYIDGGLAAMNFMLALETLGLSSCPINWPDIAGREKSIKEKLDLRNEERCVLCFAVGYADPSGGIAFSERRDLTKMVQFI